MRLVKLFIATESPLLSEMTNNRVCLVMRREGLLVQYNESIQQKECPGHLLPIIDTKIIGNNVTEITAAKVIAGRMIGKRVEKYLESVPDADFFRIDGDIVCGFHTIALGVHIPNVIEMIRVAPLYGCVDALCRSQIDSEIKIFEKRYKDVPKDVTDITKDKAMIVQLLKHRKNPNLKSSEDDYLDILADDLKYADKILAHFQMIADLKRERQMKEVNKKNYARDK